MAEIDVVVAIVTYKSATLTIDCLRSIEAERAASRLKIRVMVVDNASGDAAPIAEAIRTSGWSSWVRLIEAPKNGGFAYGNNVALQAAYGETPPIYFFLLNPDTRIVGGAIEALVRFLETHPQVGIAGGSVESPSGEPGPFAFRFPSLMSEVEAGLKMRAASFLLRPWSVAVDPGPSPQQVDWVGGASMMVRRDVVDAIGGLDENYFLYFEETDFCFRAKKAGFEVWYVPESRVIHYEAQSTTAGQTGPRRKPSFWFESRRHYFVATHGMLYATLTDMAALTAHALGYLKAQLTGRTASDTPNFVSDLAGHSLLKPGNRRSLPIKHFVPNKNA